MDGLWSSGGFYSMYEPVFLSALSDDLLSFAAIQCRYGNKERDVQGDYERYLFLLFLYDAASDSDDGIWEHDDCILCGIQCNCLCSGIPAGAKDF